MGFRILVDFFVVFIWGIYNSLRGRGSIIEVSGLERVYFFFRII